jgi:hypothetical protein
MQAVNWNVKTTCISNIVQRTFITAGVSQVAARSQHAAQPRIFASTEIKLPRLTAENSLNARFVQKALRFLRLLRVNKTSLKTFFNIEIKIRFPKFHMQMTLRRDC